MPRSNKYMELVGKLEKKLSVMEESMLLPPEQKLAEEFGVSKPTLRRALQEMVDCGRVRKINGVGVMVGKPPKSISRELIFVCRDITFFANTLKNFGSAALDANYFISIVPLDGDAQTQERIITSVAERRPAGIVIYADTKHNDLNAFHQLAMTEIPTLYLMRLPKGIDNNLLEFGNSDGVTEIVETFYNEGRRKIAMFAAYAVNRAALFERESGFLAGMKKCRLKVRPEFCCGYKATEEERENFIKLFENETNRPDAVCCMNDHCAGFLIKELIKRKINIDNILFSGFDHSPLSEFIPQPLLTVDPPMDELGTAAAEMLIKQVENPHFGFQRRKLKARVISTK